MNTISKIRAIFSKARDRVTEELLYERKRRIPVYKICANRSPVIVKFSYEGNRARTSFIVRESEVRRGPEEVPLERRAEAIGTKKGPPLPERSG